MYNCFTTVSPTRAGRNSVKVLLIQDFRQNRIRGFCLSEVYSVKVLLIQDFHTAATVHPHSGRTGCVYSVKVLLIQDFWQNRIRGFCLSEVYKWIFGHYNILSRLRKS